jgi:MFS family permease
MAASEISPYRELLRLPGAAGFCAAGIVGRMPMAMFGLGTVLLITAMTGRYGLAGLVAAAGSVCYAACAPQIARLADRHGQHRVLRPLAVFFGLDTALFVACALLHAPLWALVAAGGLAGAAMPSLGSMVRARWSALIRGDTRLIHTAFAIESVADELIFVIGPTLVTLLATEVYPAAGVIAAAGLGVTGTLLFAAQRRTQPPVTPGPAGPGPGSRSVRAARPRIPAPGLVTLAPVYLFVGQMFASIELSTVDFAQEHGHKPLAGLILGCYALGSACGGLWYGSRPWRAPLERRFALTLCITTAGVATFWALPGLAWLTVVIFVCGLTIAPTLIGGYGLVERQAPVARQTEGMAWLSSTISVGVAAGSAIAGYLIDVGGARLGYFYAAGSGLMAALICLAGLSRLRLAPPERPAQPGLGGTTPPDRAATQWADAELPER